MFTKSDLKVGVGGPGCEDGAVNEGLPGSGLFATNLKGFGGGKNVGGIGGGKVPIGVSDVPRGLVHSLAFVNVDV